MVHSEYLNIFLHFSRCDRFNEHDFYSMVVRLWRRSSVLLNSFCTSEWRFWERKKLIFRRIQINLFVLQRSTYRAIKALTVIVVWQCLDPSIASLDWETACKTFRGEQFIPIGFTIWTSFFQEEWTVAEQFTAISAIEAIRMEMLSNGIQAIALESNNCDQLKKEKMKNSWRLIYLNFGAAFVARRCQEFLKAIFAVQIALLFDKSDILKWTTASTIDAYEMVWTPDASQCRYEWTSVPLQRMKRKKK